MCGSAHGQPWVEAAVMVVGDCQGSESHGSGIIVGSDGTAAVVLTCRHALRGAYRVRVYRPGRAKGYLARPIAIHRTADLAALLIKDTGGFSTIPVASREGGPGFLVGFGTAERLRVARGDYLGHAAHNALYSFRPEEGDSGGGVFTLRGELLGVAWARSEREGVAVGLEATARFLEHPDVAQYLVRDSAPVASLQSPPCGGTE
jgi:S1-C subfamily serine protease